VLAAPYLVRASPTRSSAGTPASPGGTLRPGTRIAPVATRPAVAHPDPPYLLHRFVRGEPQRGGPRPSPSWLSPGGQHPIPGQPSPLPAQLLEHPGRVVRVPAPAFSSSTTGALRPPYCPGEPRRLPWPVRHRSFQQSGLRLTQNTWPCRARSAGRCGCQARGGDCPSAVFDLRVPRGSWPVLRHALPLAVSRIRSLPIHPLQVWFMGPGSQSLLLRGRASGSSAGRPLTARNLLVRPTMM